MQRLLLADDHPLVFHAIREALPRSGYRVVAECQDAPSALSALRALAPDLLILDLHLPGGGLKLLNRLRSVGSRMRVLILSADDERVSGLRAMRAGADGYLPKTATAADLLHAIEFIMRGKRFFRARVTEGVISADSNDDALLGSLSDREFSVLKGLAEGRSNGEIALFLALTPKTVSACRNKLMRKLSLPNLPALIHFARVNHVILD
jgi:DNA-binding NarL/FixJ family response regulator